MAIFEARRVDRRRPRLAPLVAVAMVVFGWSAWTATPSAPPEHAPLATLGTQPGRVAVSASFANPRLVATRALVDFGLDAGARYVGVRILSGVDLEVVLQADTDVVLSSYPDLCLIGPFAMPDYAGLSEPCWGRPDLSDVVRARLPTDAQGRPVLRANRAVTLHASLVRDVDRCDYPPGDWQLEVAIEPLREHASGPRFELFAVPLDLPAGSGAPLALVRPTKYCGLANVAYREQGEPALEAGRPSGRP